MKRFIFISLLVMPFCKGADVPKSWEQATQNISDSDLEKAVELELIHEQIEAIPENLGDLLPCLEKLNLNYNLISAIPDNLRLSEVWALWLVGNRIEYIDPEKIFTQFPNLVYLNLSKNPLTNVDEIRKKVGTRQGFVLNADDIGEKYLPAGRNMKGAKR